MSCPYKPEAYKAPEPTDDNLPKAKRSATPVYYNTYLGLDKILSAQEPMSLKVGGKLAHEEMLFIIIHQTYELWFKQILFDLDSCMTIFNAEEVPEHGIGTVLRRLERICRILSQLVGQISILETMTPLDFLDFRDYLFPASGFQSVQFRILENKLGLRRQDRLKYARSDYCGALNEEHKHVVEDVEKAPSMFELVERWLERTPFLESEDFDFWSEYKTAVKNMYKNDQEDITSDYRISDEEKAVRLEEVKVSEAAFMDLFDEAAYEEMRTKGKRRLSYNAMKAAILISLYRDEPIFQMPYKMLMYLIEIDSHLTSWRQRHASMVHRMLGMKMGTGGSSGYNYLKATATHHKVFADFSSLSMFLIPRSSLPRLPKSIEQRLRFHYSDIKGKTDDDTDSVFN